MTDPIIVKLTLKSKLANMEFVGPIEEAIVSAMTFARDHRDYSIEVTVTEEVEDV